VVKIIVNNVILDHPQMLVITVGFQVKKQIAVLLALFQDILKTLTIYLMVGHGVNMNGHIIALLQDSELIKGIACGKNQHRLGILLGIKQNQDVLIVVQEKPVGSSLPMIGDLGYNAGRGDPRGRESHGS
jgi:hypothetical protein